jgi:hypothetical protein
MGQSAHSAIITPTVNASMPRLSACRGNATLAPPKPACISTQVTTIRYIGMGKREKQEARVFYRIQPPDRRSSTMWSHDAGRIVIFASPDQNVNRAH